MFAPPLAVKIPYDECIPSISSGEVSSLTKIIFLPYSFNNLALLEVKQTSPTAAPGEAANPFPNLLAFSQASGSN